MKILNTAICAATVLLGAVAAQAGTVVVQGDSYPLSRLNNFYNSYGGHTSTIGAGPVSGLNLAGVNLLWAVQPTSAYTGADITKMQGYLSSGGRIAFMGEHGSFMPSQNNNINAALTALGSTIQIVNVIEDSGFRTASVGDGQILAHSLTAGVNSYQYGAFAPLTISGSAQALMMGEDNPAAIMMAYQNIGAGSIFLITDQNVWDNAPSLWPSHDNEVMFDNLVAGRTVGGVPEPASWAMLIIGFGAMGGAMRYRRREAAASHA
jgi:roadblock/LC7 domain-containing protein